MCDGVGVAMAGLSAGSTAMDILSGNSAAAAQADAQRQQKINILKQGNYQDANLKLQQKSSWESARSELTSANLTQLQALGSIKSAVSESGMEGNTMDRLVQSVELSNAMDSQAIKDNEELNQAELWGQRLTNYNNTTNQIDSISGSFKKPSLLASALGVASSGASGYVAGKDLGESFRKGSNMPKSAAPSSPDKSAVKTRKGG